MNWNLFMYLGGAIALWIILALIYAKLGMFKEDRKILSEPQRKDSIANLGMKLSHYLHILLWCVYAPHRAKYYYYRVEKCGMMAICAYRSAKILTRANWKQLQQSIQSNQ